MTDYCGCGASKPNMVYTSYGHICSQECFDKLCENILGATSADFAAAEKTYRFVFYNRFACQTQLFTVKAKNKHVARHKFWAKYPRASYKDCIEGIFEG
jgi:hypothetical protein